MSQTQSQVSYTFTPDSSTDINGAFFLTHLDNITIEQVAENFPSGVSKSPYYDPEKGYDGPEVLFRSTSGANLYVYARWGMARVGSTQDLSQEELASFISFLTRPAVEERMIHGC